MAEIASSVCFTCGLPVGDPMRLNHLPGGQVCPTCRDRLLDTLAAPLPERPWDAVTPSPRTDEGEEAGEEPTDEAQRKSRARRPSRGDSEPPASA